MELYLLDLERGALSIAPVVGEFNGNRGEFYDQEQYKGRSILVRYVWTWETNWICELS